MYRLVLGLGLPPQAAVMWWCGGFRFPTALLFGPDKEGNEILPLIYKYHNDGSEKAGS